MNLIDWIGSVAAILTTASFVPQASQVRHLPHHFPLFIH
jgi:uncharacterized protein with PQ loop repeat